MKVDLYEIGEVSERIIELARLLCPPGEESWLYSPLDAIQGLERVLGGHEAIAHWRVANQRLLERNGALAKQNEILICSAICRGAEELDEDD